MTKPHISSEITFGNLVSWGLIALGFVAGYFQLRAQVDSTAIVAKDAKETAIAAQISISDLKTDIAVIKNATANIDRTVQEFRTKFIPVKQNSNGN